MIYARSLGALLFGSCIPFALAPFNFWPMSFIGIMGFYWLTFKSNNTKEAAWYGWLYGLSFFGIGISWIYQSMRTVEIPSIFSISLTLGFCMLMALLMAFQSGFFYRYLKPLPYALLLLAPCWWVINEWIREWLLTGMPWLYVSYSLIHLPITQLAAVVGMYGLSLIIAFLSCLFLYAMYLIKAQRIKAISLLLFGGASYLVLHVLGSIFTADYWTQPERTISVAAIQSNISQKEKWLQSQQPKTLDFFYRSINQASMIDKDLILWPEAAITQVPEHIPNYLNNITRIGQQRDQSIVTGIILYDQKRYYNALLGLGNAQGEYKKQHLVPFGEYIPFESYVKDLLQLFQLPLSSIYPAPAQQYSLQMTLEDQEYLLAGIICYEAAYPNIVRELAVDSHLILMVSNDAWFGDSIAPHQHLQITQMRAIENGRDLLRSTQNGISALISAQGHIISRSAQFEVAETSGKLTLRSGLTPFQRLSPHTVIYACIVLMLLIIAFQYSIRKPPYKSE